MPEGQTQPAAMTSLVDSARDARWRAADYPGLLSHSPQVIAATVLRDAGTRRDDAGVLVARAP